MKTKSMKRVLTVLMTAVLAFTLISPVIAQRRGISDYQIKYYDPTIELDRTWANINLSALRMYLTSNDWILDIADQSGNVQFKAGVGGLFVGDDTNTKAAKGITINQGVNDDEIIALKSSDVAHSVTTDTETDTYGRILKASATLGGLEFRGYTDATSSSGALVLGGTLGATDPTDTDPAVVIAGSKLSGTARGALGAAETVFQLKNYTTNLITVLGDGKVGIGIQTPTTGKLEVLGSNTIPAIFYGLGGTSTEIISQSGNTPNNGWKWMQDEASTGNMFLKRRVSTVDSDVVTFARSNGYVGIGTTSPGARLETSLDNSAGGGQLYITNTSQTWNTTKTSDITFRLTDQNGINKKAAIIRVTANDPNSSAGDNLTFFTRTMDADPTEKVRIDNNGNVGIGTTSPNAALHVLNATGPQFIITDTNKEDSLTVEVDGNGDVKLKPSGGDFTVAGAINYGADTGGDDTYVIALSPAITAYSTAQMFLMTVAFANVGACTVDFGGGAKNIKTVSGADPADNDILTTAGGGGIAILVYNGTNMVLINPATTCD